METNVDIKKKILNSNAEYHDEWAETHDSNVPYICRQKTRKYYWTLIKENLSACGRPIKESDILEIGCGTGTFTDLFISHGARRFTGIDLSPKMIAKASEKASQGNYDVPVTFAVSSLEEFAKNNIEKFDIIQSSSFIHHLSDVDEGMNCINRMLKPNGIYIAIHEEINTIEKTPLEKLDEQLQYLWGYSGSNTVDFPNRIKQVLKNLIIAPIKGVLKKAKKKHTPPIPDRNDPSDINFVDFQLNNPFSLTEQCSQYGEVKPYCYLGFSELMMFGRPLNHEMLIMKKQAMSK